MATIVQNLTRRANNISTLKNATRTATTTKLISGRSISSTNTWTMSSDLAREEAEAFSKARTLNDKIRGTTTENRVYYIPDAEVITRHLEETFYPLKFPKDLACRIATHKAAADVLGNHNSRFSFLGSCFLRYTLLTFLQEHRQKLPNSTLTEPSINKYLGVSPSLGKNVGRELGIHKCMRWCAVRDPSGQWSGLFKARGQMVEAVVGGVFRHYGAHEAQNLIYAYILPKLGLPQEVSEQVEQLQNQGRQNLGKSSSS